jgi:hypothetical protein
VEALQEGDGDEDNDGLLAVADLDLIVKVHVSISVPSKVRAHKLQKFDALRSRRRGVPLRVIVSIFF